jgi:hypothetical protein
VNVTQTMGPTAEERPDLTTLGGAGKYFFSFAGPRFLLAQLLIAALARPFLDAPSFWDLVVVLGVAIYWPLQEWFFHWTLLHMRPKKLGPFTVDLYFSQTHRHHHRNPWQIETSLLPLRVLFSIAPVHLLFWWAVTPTLGAACTGVAVFTGATLFYEWIHYLTHTPYKPTGSYYRTVRRNHRLHHFRNENYWHSFTAPFIDSLFGTGPKNPGDVPRSETCMDLGVPNEE